MPKIIADTEGKILRAAKALFLSHQYIDIEMKSIAKEAGIAVGTMYNYFPNKQTLYYKIFEESWEDTYKSLKAVVNSNMDPLEKIREYMKMAYDEIEKNGKLGMDIIRNSQITSEKPMEFFTKNEIIMLLCQCLQEIRGKYGVKLEKEMDERFAETAVLMVMDSLLIHPSEKTSNMEFIIKTINCVVG